jgi:hypothetical protein
MKPGYKPDWPSRWFFNDHGTINGECLASILDDIRLLLLIISLILVWKL